MANGPALSTARGCEIYVESEITDSLSLLDVLYANQFQKESFDPKLLKHTEQNFYRGAPPVWLNFHKSEQAESDDKGTPFIKRDGYETLVEQIRQRRKRPGTSTVKLFHQPGCGGTTLAMQVLWDLKKTFRCAVLTDSTSDITNVAEEVVHLFTAGSRGNQNTVLLLVNGEHILENLQKSIMKIAEQKIVTYMPVVILLSCVRIDAVLQGYHVVLQEKLSDSEKQKFNEKKKELSRTYIDKYKQFHGFNIMQSNFSQDYVKDACKIFSTVHRANRPKKTQLAAFLSLLNAYVPGSYLLESQCLDFFKHDDSIHGDLSLEDRMKPFSHLIITFQQDEKKVRMAHPMIAKCCTELMAEAGVTRSDTARNFLNCFCRDEVPPFLLGFVKDMLTKREKKMQENPEIKENTMKFSRLILDIQKKEGNDQSASVLKVASKIFYQNPFFPQALARICYIAKQDYNQAEIWANTAKQRDPQNSFVADTLGQVHKNHLQNPKRPAKPGEIQQLATKAIKAFKHEEQLAEKEHGSNMREDGMTNLSYFFNTRGQFGYLKVCNLVYDFLKLHRDNKLFNDLINRDEVEKKIAFLDKYLTYSKPDMKKVDPSYISRDIFKCYRNYVGDSPSKPFVQNDAVSIQKIKQMLAGTSTGELSCLDREYTESELQEITTWWEEIFLRSSCKSLTAFEQKIPLSPTDEPELHLFTLLLCWPTDSEDKCVFDLHRFIENLHCSYEHAYKTYFRTRYLRPLFFIGKGRDLNRIVHIKVLKGLFPEQTHEDWSNETIFQHSKIKERLLKVDGVVQNYGLYATIDGAKIKVHANLRNSLWKPHQVSFYLGFTIRGPVAFDIQTKTEKVEVSKMEISKPEQIKPEPSAWTDTTVGQHFVDRHQAALINGVSDTIFILGKLKDRGLILNENYDAVRALQTTQDQMSGILQCLPGTRGKDALYEILKKMKSMRPLIAELEDSE